MPNPYTPPEFRGSRKHRWPAEWVLLIVLFIASVLIVATHLAIISISYNHVLPYASFEWISAILMVLAVPPLAVQNNENYGRAAKATCILAGFIIPLAYFANPGIQLSSELGWTVLSRFVLCTIMPVGLLLKSVARKTAYRNGVAALIAIGYLQAIAVDNPMISRYYIGWPN